MWCDEPCHSSLPKTAPELNVGSAEAVGNEHKDASEALLAGRDRISPVQRRGNVYV